MSIPDLDTLAEHLEDKLVPVCLANGALAAFMMGNAKEIFHTSNPGHAQLLVCLAMVGQLKGLGLDIPATYVERIESSTVELAAWIRMTCIAVMNGVDNIDTQLFALFEGLLKDQADLERELKQSNQTYRSAAAAAQHAKKKYKCELEWHTLSLKVYM